MMQDRNLPLLDIVENIKIEDFNICHPNYPLLELIPKSSDRWHRLSPELQSKYVSLRGRDYLHDLYFTHRQLDLNMLAEIERNPTPIANNVVNGVDIDFCWQLQQQNSSRGHFDADWQIISTTADGEFVVVKDGLHLHIDPQFHLTAEYERATPGDLVPIWLPPSLVAKDTYIIVGDAGKPIAAPDTPATVRLYFNFTPTAAVTIAGLLTHSLNQLAVPFQFAILHDPQLFHRYDGGTLWLWQADYERAQSAIADIYRSHQQQFSPQIPLFSKQLAPGLGLAEEPPADNFGRQRCELVAASLIAAVESGIGSSDAKLDNIRDRFIAAGIDWQQPYLNPGSTDRYTTFVS